jgi:hypothetical protein
MSGRPQRYNGVMAISRTKGIFAAISSALALATSPLDAQQPAPADAVPEPSLIYQIEILAFTYDDFNGQEENFATDYPSRPPILGGTERRPWPWIVFPAGVLEPLQIQHRDVAFGEGRAAWPPVGSSTIAAPLAARPAAARWYRLLADDELTLDGALARLRNLGAYTPFLHAGWSQPVLLENEAKPFDLASLGAFRPSGTVRLHLSRFLHLTLNLSLQTDYRYRWQSPAESASATPLYELLRPVQYRIQGQRRVRGGELHFFDHPAFGVLIMVRPQPAAPEDESTGPAA